MDFFRAANQEEVVRYEAPGGAGWVELRAEFSKGEVNKLALTSPTDDKDRAGALTFVEKFLELAVVNWSAPKPFDIKQYRALAAEPAQWLEKTALEHLSKTIGKETEELEGKLEA